MMHAELTCYRRAVRFLRTTVDKAQVPHESQCPLNAREDQNRKPQHTQPNREVQAMLRQHEVDCLGVAASLKIPRLRVCWWIIPR